jgi:hypothetical protein
MTSSVRTLEVVQETCYKVAELMATVKKSRSSRSIISTCLQIDGENRSESRSC